MKNKIEEMDLSVLLKALKEYKLSFLNEDSKVSEKMLNKIDELETKTKLLMSDDNLDNKIVVGSLVDLVVRDENYSSQYITCYLGLEWDNETISIFSPLGSAIFAANVGQTVHYSVKDTKLEATILNKNVIVEKFPEDITLSNAVYDIPVKSKVRN